MNTKELEKRCNELFFQVNEKTERVAELEKENAELKLKLEALEGQTPWKDIKDKSELIKENAELKAFKEKCKFNVSDICKEIEIENNLIKAKELLKEFIFLLHNPRTALDTKTVMDKAEQFIKDSEVEK